MVKPNSRLTCRKPVRRERCLSPWRPIGRWVERVRKEPSERKVVHERGLTTLLFSYSPGGGLVSAKFHNDFCTQHGPQAWKQPSVWHMAVHSISVKRPLARDITGYLSDHPFLNLQSLPRTKQNQIWASIWRWSDDTSSRERGCTDQQFSAPVQSSPKWDSWRRPAATTMARCTSRERTRSQESELYSNQSLFPSLANVTIQLTELPLKRYPNL